jgi:hypothetical protein
LTAEENEKEVKTEACGGDAHDHLNVEDPSLSSRSSLSSFRPLVL